MTEWSAQGHTQHTVRVKIQTQVCCSCLGSFSSGPDLRCDVKASPFLRKWSQDAGRWAGGEDRDGGSQERVCCLLQQTTGEQVCQKALGTSVSASALPHWRVGAPGFTHNFPLVGRWGLSWLRLSTLLQPERNLLDQEQPVFVVRGPQVRGHLWMILFHAR